MQLDDMRARALGVRDLYDQLNGQKRGRAWTREELMLGFMGDVGDLAKLVAVAEGARDLPGGPDALAHELADCLWCVLVLADAYGVDLPTEFERTMDQVTTALTAEIDTL